MIVEWDPHKNHANRAKHGVSFEDGREVFVADNEYLEIFDQEHSGDEDRFIAIGPTAKGILVVVWTERDAGVTRLISVRKATPQERRLFHSYMEGRQ